MELRKRTEWRTYIQVQRCCPVCALCEAGKVTASECRASLHRVAMNKGHALAPLRGYPQKRRNEFFTLNNNI